MINAPERAVEERAMDRSSLLCEHTYALDAKSISEIILMSPSPQNSK
jgi:hypothetical protein